MAYEPLPTVHDSVQDTDRADKYGDVSILNMPCNAAVQSACFCAKLALGVFFSAGIPTFIIFMLLGDSSAPAHKFLLHNTSDIDHLHTADISCVLGANYTDLAVTTHPSTRKTTSTAINLFDKNISTTW